MTLKTPEGTKDLLMDEAGFWEQFKQSAYSVFGNYGYQIIETPLFEQTELFVRGIGEATDVVGKEMFQVLSGANLEKLLAGGTLKNKSRLSLRPEGTAGVVRAVVEHDLVPQGAPPVKLMYAGPMFRAERPQKGRYRQFYQVGIECLGAEAPTVDAEAIIMLMQFYQEIGLEPQNMNLIINSMGCDTCRPVYRDLVYQFLMEHKEDLCEECIRRAEMNPLRAFDCKNPGCAEVMESAPRISDHLCDDCSTHYNQVKTYLHDAELTFQEDWRLVRGLDYYTRTVFEVQVIDGLGSQNAIGGGGRYDKLSEEIGGRPMTGLGFALGFERCLLALQARGKVIEENSSCDFFCAAVDDSTRNQAFSLAQKLRLSGYYAEVDHQSRSLKSQFKLADKLHARFTIIIGPDELADGSLKVRNMQTHEETLVAFDNAVNELQLCYNV